MSGLLDSNYTKIQWWLTTNQNHNHNTKSRSWTKFYIMGRATRMKHNKEARKELRPINLKKKVQWTNSKTT